MLVTKLRHFSLTQVILGLCGVTNLCRAFYWVRKVCAGRFIGYEKSVPGVLLGMTSLCRAFYWVRKVCAGRFIGYDKSVPGVLLGMTSLYRMFYWV